MKKLFKRAVILGLFFGGLGILLNLYVLGVTKSKIYDTVENVPEAYTVLVLGARVYDSGNLSSYLEDRVEKALELYQSGKVERFLLSGDHGKVDYDEVNAMKSYLLEKGVPESDIFLDHAGFNTYNSVIRAKKVFQVENLVIVTQDYHLPRAVFIAHYSGMKVYGLSSSSAHLGATKRNKIREFLARIKSFGEVAVDIPPKYLGDEIPITGDSHLSFD